MAEAPKVIHFNSKALPDDTLLVARLAGREEISRLYRFELELVSKKADIDFAKVLKEPAWLGLKTPVRLKDSGVGTRLLKINGMLALFSQEEKKSDWVRYRATLVPRLWRTTLTVQSRIFMDKDVKGVVGDVLTKAGFAETDYEFKLSGSYPKREYVVQYQESDFNFLSRWLEHEGVFYYFEQTEQGDKVVFCDATSHYATVAGGAKIPYRPIAHAGGRVAEEGASDWFKEEVVQSLSCRQGVIPKEVVLKDYNWRTPSKDLKVSEPVVSDGVGVSYEYANHYKDTNEGKALAKVRAEEIKCRQKVFSGTSDHKAFRAGAKFKLADHYRGDFNTDYLLVEVDHRAEQALGLPWSTATGTTYGNRFTAIPSTETFRPERLTPWPSIHGSINANVDAGGSGQYAEIDEMGRYKVKLPFDLSDKKDGLASRFVRMAQPYAGPDMGMHFPLHKGTEVLLTFVDGDPDRPVIASSVPNPEKESPVTGPNQSQCVLRSAARNELAFEDTEGSEYITLTTPAHLSHMSLGATHSSVPGSTAEGIACPDGVIVGTQQGVSVNAGEGVNIAAGSPNHTDGITHGAAHASSAEKWSAGIASVLGTIASVGADVLASGPIAAIPAAAADIGGCIAGLAGHKSVYISAPHKIAAMAGAEVIVGAGATIDISSIGAANMLSVFGSLVGSVNTASVVAGRHVEMVSGFGNVKVQAKFRGNVDIEAKKSITAKANTKDIEFTAKCNTKHETQGRWFQIVAKENFLIKTVDWPVQVLVDKDKKKLSIVAGKPGTSSIVMEDDKITIEADTIILKSKDGNATLGLGKEPKDKMQASFFAQSKNKLLATSNEESQLHSKKKTVIAGKDKVRTVGKELDETGCKKINRDNSEEG